MLKLLLLFLAVIFSGTSNAQSTALRTGKHSITLQWISWEKPGAARVRQAGLNTYPIKGIQRSADGRDSLYINGVLSVLSNRELSFYGTIVTTVHHIRNGQPCVREGQQIFLSTGKRRYWRLQEMMNCDGETTDYVDIYF